MDVATKKALKQDQIEEIGKSLQSTFEELRDTAEAKAKDGAAAKAKEEQATLQAKLDEESKKRAEAEAARAREAEHARARADSADRRLRTEREAREAAERARSQPPPAPSRSVGEVIGDVANGTVNTAAAVAGFAVSAPFRIVNGAV